MSQSVCPFQPENKMLTQGFPFRKLGNKLLYKKGPKQVWWQPGDSVCKSKERSVWGSAKDSFGGWIFFLKNYFLLL